jgi:alpha-1,3-rhamnosyltransferase
MDEYMPLVTVGIATYNSSDFILETLESIYAQTYPNIELIVSDDASTDDTMQIVREWLETDNRKERFADVKILEVEQNTGPSANANRKLKVSAGEWIKGIGHDDTLLPNCVSDNIRFIREHPPARVVFSKINLYNNNFEGQNFLYTTPGEISDDSILRTDRPAESQYKMLLVSDRIHFTPSVFIHRETLNALGGYDEKIKLLEDYPLWLNLTKSGYKLYFMDEITVNYRQHAKAINNTGIKFLINPNYFKQEGFRKLYTYPHLPADIRLDQQYKWHVSKVFKSTMMNRDTIINKILYNTLTVLLNPFRIYLFVKKHLNKRSLEEEFYF